MPVALALMDGLTRDDWVELRRQGLGGSDAAAVCGLDPYKSPIDLWTEKTGIGAEEFQGNRFTEWGNRLEHVVADYFAERNAVSIERPPAMYRHDEHPWMFANPDRFIHAERGTGILEVKTAGERHEPDWAGDTDKGETPVRAVLQGTWYMAVTGHRYAYVAGLLGGNDYRQRLIERDDELVDMLIARGAEFWEMVENEWLPPADSHRATTAALKRIYEYVDDGAHVELTVDQAEAVVELRGLKAEAKTLEARIEGLENEVRAVLGHCPVGMFDGSPFVTWKPQKDSRVDMGLLKSAHTEIAESCTRTKTIRVLRIPKGK